MGLYKRKAWPMTNTIKPRVSTTLDMAVSYRLPLPNEQLLNDYFRSKCSGELMATPKKLVYTAWPSKFVGGIVNRKYVLDSKNS